MKSYSDYRALARESLQGNWSNFALVYLIIWFFTVAISIVSTALSFIPTANQLVYEYWIMGITLALTLFLVTPFQYGFYNAALSIARQELVDPMTETVRYFQKDYNRSIPTYLISYLAILGLSLITFCIGGVILQYAYAMVPYLLRDYPELTPMEALRTSRQMMRGHKWDLFVLDLTFIGWYILSILTFGIGMLWLAPYVHTAHAHYYISLKEVTIVEE